MPAESNTPVKAPEADTYLSGICPSCFNRIDYRLGETTVHCVCCEGNFTPSALQPMTESREETASVSEKQATLFSAIDTSEAGLAYLESFFAAFNWEAFEQSDSLTISAVTDMVDKNKVRYANTASTWVLEFKSILTPLSHKLSGLAALEEKIIGEYGGEDDAGIYSFYDRHDSISRKLREKRSEFLHRMQTDLDFAAKFEADPELLSSMKEQLCDLSEKLNALRPYARLEDMPCYARAKEKAEKKLVQDLAAAGIDAGALYRQAIAAYEADRKTEALALFRKVEGYGNAEGYIEKLDNFFLFKSEYLEISGKRYIVRDEKPAALDLSKMNRPEEEPQNEEEPADDTDSTRKHFALYEIVDGKVAKEAVLSGIRRTITNFGTYYFFAKDNAICCFDVAAADPKTAVTVLLEVKMEDCSLNEEMIFTPDGLSFLFKRKLHVSFTPILQKSGCLSGLFHRKQEPTVVRNMNNFSLCRVNMAARTCETVIPEMIDVMDSFGDTVFYSCVEKEKGIDSEHFRVYSIKDGHSSDILDPSCEIHSVTGKKIIYSVWTPNAYNKDLHITDIATHEDLCLESNIYDYVCTVGDRVCYTVGNGTVKPMFMIGLDGSDRREVMAQYVEIRAVIGDWMYVMLGGNELVKISAKDGRRVLVCSRLKSLVKVTSGYVYYINQSDEFHTVRSDGRNDRKIADGLKSDDIIVDRDAIYYLRREAVATKRYAYSLYRMDLQGRNARKLVFDVEAMQEFDADTICFRCNKTIIYQISIPVSKTEYNTTYSTAILTRYCYYHKAADQIETVVVLGEPEIQHFEFKRGCLQKKTELDTVIKEVPPQVVNRRRGVAKAGEVASEDEEQDEDEK